MQAVAAVMQVRARTLVQVLGMPAVTTAMGVRPWRSADGAGLGDSTAGEQRQR
jgi:hypothetical protein